MKAKQWADRIKQATDADSFSDVLDAFMQETIDLVNTRKEVESSVREQFQKWLAVARQVEGMDKDVFFEALEYCAPELYQAFMDKSKKLLERKLYKNVRVLHKRAFEEAKQEKDVGMKLVLMWAAILEWQDRDREIKEEVCARFGS